MMKSEWGYSRVKVVQFSSDVQFGSGRPKINPGSDHTLDLKRGSCHLLAGEVQRLLGPYTSIIVQVGL